MKLDKKDCMMLDLLQKNCRMPLTAIAKEVGLSVDSVKKRMDKMLAQKVFYPKIQLRPRNFGFSNVVEIKIRIYNHTKKDINEFVAFLQNHPRIIEAFSVAGEWDFSVVVIAKDALDLGNLNEQIRIRFGNIIQSWSESLTTKSYKFEMYDMQRLYEEGQLGQK